MIPIFLWSVVVSQDEPAALALLLTAHDDLGRREVAVAVDCIRRLPFLYWSSGLRRSASASFAARA